MINIEKIIQKLESTNQRQLFKYFEDLNPTEKSNLINQILDIDFTFINNLYKNSFNDESIDLKKISPSPLIIQNQISEIESNKYTLIGEEILKRNAYALVTLAGGLGTRLGHNGPKGTFELELHNHKLSIFELFINQLKSINKKYKITISWYIMTSNNNHDMTIDFFEKHNFFDYPKDKVIFFIQGELPIVDEDGKCLLKNKSTVLMGPNGNGDVYKALKENDLLTKMKNDKIEWLFFGTIDNILLKLADPEFLGTVIANNYRLASKTIFKTDEHDKQWVFCSYNNHPYMLRSKDITPKISNLTDNKGNYLYREVNIAMHLIHISYVELFANAKPVYHRAYRASNYLNDKGQDITANSANSFKFEKFIFDHFSLADNMLLYRINPNEEFAPIKNLVGQFSPDWAQNKYEKIKSTIND